MKNMENTGYEEIKNIISHIDEFYTEAELREEMQEILFICEKNIKTNEENKKIQTISNK